MRVPSVQNFAGPTPPLPQTDVPSKAASQQSKARPSRETPQTHRERLDAIKKTVYNQFPEPRLIAVRGAGDKSRSVLSLGKSEDGGLMTNKAVSPLKSISTYQMLPRFQRPEGGQIAMPPSSMTLGGGASESGQSWRLKTKVGEEKRNEYAQSQVEPGKATIFPSLKKSQSVANVGTSILKHS